MTVVLMSIKPIYAEMIFGGQKTVELRRVCPKVVMGDLVIVYATTPRKAVIGAFEVKGVVAASPVNLRRECLKESGVSRAAFDKYFHDLRTGFAIRIGERWIFRKPYELSQLRGQKGGFTPPQSFRYLRNGEEKMFVSGEGDPTATEVR